MASVISDPNGRKRIQFVAGNGRRKTLRLGKATAKQADAFKVRVEQLILAATGATSAIDEDTARWLAALDDRIHGKLAAVGLVKPRNRTAATLGTFLGEFFTRLSVKSGTVTAYGQTRRCLIEHFGEDRPLRDISPADADAWRSWLVEQGFSNATVSRRVGVARQFFKKAMRWKLVAENPFIDVKMGRQNNQARAFFVSREIAGKVLDACIDDQWRLLFALARYGGLRCPSETLSLRWGDVDWERNKIRVPSPKTEHHADGDCRYIPLFPELLHPLREVFEKAQPGEEWVITRYRLGTANLGTQLRRIVRKAGVKPWPRLWQNLRATRETELAERYPIHVVCAWIGNSRAVAQSHYLQVTDEHFEQAAMGAESAAQKAAQQVAELDGTASQAKQKPSICEGLRGDAIPNESLMGAVGFEPT